MRERSLTLPEIFLIGSTRAALGAGLALLLGSKLSADARRAAGWTLFAVGALSTIPLALQILGKPREPHLHLSRMDSPRKDS